MDIRPGNAQWQGTRSEQQDAFGFVGFEDPPLRTHGGLLAVLADGMGGLSNGRQASRLACEQMMAAYAQKGAAEPIGQALERALAAANQAVYRLAQEGEGEGQVGTTLVAAVVRGAELHWVGVGDSRLYRYRAEDDSLTLCTTDHNYGNRLLQRVAAGALDPTEAGTDTDRQALTSFLGLAVIPEIDHNLHPVHIAPGDRLLLCSDGVYGVLPEADLRQLLRRDAQAAADSLIGAVKALGLPDQDNATVAILGIEPDAATDPSPPPTDARRTSRPRHWGILALALGGLLLVLIGALICAYIRLGGGPTPGGLPPINPDGAHHSRLNPFPRGSGTRTRRVAGQGSSTPKVTAMMGTHAVLFPQDADIGTATTAVRKAADDPLEQVKESSDQGERRASPPVAQPEPPMPRRSDAKPRHHRSDRNAGRQLWTNASAPSSSVATAVATSPSVTTPSAPVTRN